MSKFALLLKYQNLVIFLFIAFLAIQAFSLIEIYKINFPYAFDMTSMTIFLDYMYSTDDYTTQEFFDTLLSETNSRGIIFPKLIVTPNYLLNNFDSGNIFYLNWIVVSLTLAMIFFTIKNSNKKLYWTLIPISAFLFSPLVNSNYWNYTMLIWYLVGFCVVSVVYLMTKKRTISNTVYAITFSIIATYSIPMGLTVWIIGSLSMFKTFLRKKTIIEKPTLIYFSSLILIGIVYYTGNISSQAVISVDKLVSLESLSVLTTFLAVPFKLKFSELMIFFGTSSLAISIIIIYYLGTIRKKFTDIFPWILFLIASLSGAVLLRIGRFDSYFEGNLPYYSPIAGLFQIGLIMLIAVLILDIKQNHSLKKKNLILFLLISIIILQMVLLIPSYYNGWWKADYYYNEKIEHMKCYSLDTDWENCKIIYEESLDTENSHYDNLRILNYFIKNKSNIFSENLNFNEYTIKELQYFQSALMLEQEVINGEILSVNNQLLLETNKINITDESLIISGIIYENDISNVDVLYLLVDGKPFAKSNNIHLTESSSIQDLEMEWTFAILRNYLPSDCYDISIGGLSNNNPFIINNTIEICT
jgi:hypothetical protein